MATQFSSRAKASEQPRIKLENHENIASHFDDVIFLRLPEVRAITGLSKTSLYALVRAKSFPAPVRLAPRAVAWVRSEVREWAEERVLASRPRISPQSGKLGPKHAPPESWTPPRKFA
jgi:prophage regulatory protein